MWRAILAVLLIPAMLHAQDEALSPKTQKQTAPKPIPRTESYTRYNELRRGTTEDVGVALIATDFLTSPRSQVTGIESVSLTLDPEPGLNISNVTYAKSDLKKKFKSRSDEIPVRYGRWFPVEIKLSADSGAALGPHLMRGKFTYQTITDAGVSGVQQMDVVLPVTVVQHSATVTKTANWPFYHMSVAATIGLVMLCIVLLPLLIVLLPLFIWGGWWD